MMREADLQRAAREIILRERYISLATIDTKPWVAPLLYAADAQLRLYFASPKTSLHARMLKKNPSVAGAIFDSHQTAGIGTGVQIAGYCLEVPREEVAQVLTVYRSSFLPQVASYYTGHSTYRLYRITPEKIYMPDPSARIDVRVDTGLV